LTIRDVSENPESRQGEQQLYKWYSHRKWCREWKCNQRYINWIAKIKYWKKI